MRLRPTYRPDHNGECLHCDEWLDAHEPTGECPAVSLLLVMAHDWTDPVVVRDSPERAADVVRQLIAALMERPDPPKAKP